MFFFSMLEDGPRGLQGRLLPDGEVEGEDISTFGIDWEDMEDERLMEHHYQHNPPQLDNPFTSAPNVLSEVTCTPPDCPLSVESVYQLNLNLSRVVDLSSRSMLVRRHVWIEALRICTQIW
jgi:hypothetical protein